MKVSLFEKLKNVFTEETEVPIKKEVTHVTIPGTEEIEKAVETKVETKTEPKEEKFVFPVYFDDDDFKDYGEKKKKPEKEMYNFKKAEEAKKFKLSPIISPVYGVLEKNYNKEDVKLSRVEKKSIGTKITTLEMVRRKAYGSLEDEIETSIIEVEKEEPLNIIEEKIIEDYKPRRTEENMTLEELNKTDENLEDIKMEEEDLFNLIDSMYEKEEEDDVQ